MTTTRAPRILVVDEEETLTHVLRLALELEGWEVRVVPTGSGAIDAVPEEAVAAMCIAGDPDSVQERLKAYAGTADYVMLYSPSFHLTPEDTARNYDAILAAFAVS